MRINEIAYVKSLCINANYCENGSSYKVIIYIEKKNPFPQGLVYPSIKSTPQEDWGSLLTQSFTSPTISCFFLPL